MSKQDQLVEYAIQDIVENISIDEEIDFEKAMAAFYASEVFEKLCDAETGLYLESSSYVYDLYRNEKRNGHLTQEEI